MPLEIFLEVIHICFKYLKGAPNSGLYNAQTFVIIRCLSHFLLKEKQRKRDFWWNQAEMSKFVKVCQWILSSFWRMFWLQRPLENFLKVGDTCSRYLEGAPASGLYNAPTFMIIQRLNHFYWRKSSENVILDEIRQKCRSLPVDIVSFLANVLTSEATRKFSKGRRHMFKVSRRCAYIRALQRTDFCDHTVSQSFFIEGKATKTWFLMKSGRNVEVCQSLPVDFV